MEQFKSGFVYGTDAVLNVETGWIPDRVEVYNVTDGDVKNVAFPSIKTMAFTSGGVNEVKAGHKIIGATSGATAQVLDVLADTGTWAGGDAAGTLILDADTEVGTFQTEAIYYDGSPLLDDASGAATVTPGYDVDTEVAADNDAVYAYKGTEATNSKGFLHVVRHQRGRQAARLVGLAARLGPGTDQFTDGAG